MKYCARDFVAGSGIPFHCTPAHFAFFGCRCSRDGFLQCFLSGRFYRKLFAAVFLLTLVFVMRFAGGVAVAQTFSSENTLSPSTVSTEHHATILKTFEYAIGDHTKIGSVKAGFACLPRGKLLFSEIRLPRDGDLAQRLSNVIVGTSNVDSATHDRYLLEGRLENVDLRLCVPGLNIGEMKAKGKGVVQIRWSKIEANGSVSKSKLVATPLE